MFYLLCSVFSGANKKKMASYIKMVVWHACVAEYSPRLSCALFLFKFSNEKWNIFPFNIFEAYIMCARKMSQQNHHPREMRTVKFDGCSSEGVNDAAACALCHTHSLFIRYDSFLLTYDRKYAAKTYFMPYCIFFSLEKFDFIYWKMSVIHSVHLLSKSVTFYVFPTFFFCSLLSVY